MAGFTMSRITALARTDIKTHQTAPPDINQPYSSGTALHPTARNPVATNTTCLAHLVTSTSVGYGGMMVVRRPVGMVMPV